MVILARMLNLQNVSFRRMDFPKSAYNMLHNRHLIFHKHIHMMITHHLKLA